MTINAHILHWFGQVQTHARLSCGVIALCIFDLDLPHERIVKLIAGCILFLLGDAAGFLFLLFAIIGTLGTIVQGSSAIVGTFARTIEVDELLWNADIDGCRATRQVEVQKTISDLQEVALEKAAPSSESDS